MYMSAFLFEDILPNIHCNSMQEVLDRQRAEPPNSKSDSTSARKLGLFSCGSTFKLFPGANLGIDQPPDTKLFAVTLVTLQKQSG